MTHPQTSRAIILQTRLNNLFNGRLTDTMLAKMDSDVAEWLARILMDDARITPEPELLDAITEASINGFTWPNIQLMYSRAIMEARRAPADLSGDVHMQTLATEARRFHYATERSKPSHHERREEQPIQHRTGNGSKKQPWHQKVYDDASDEERELMDLAGFVRFQLTQAIKMLRTRGQRMNSIDRFSIEKVELAVGTLRQQLTTYLDQVLQRKSATRDEA